MMDSILWDNATRDYDAERKQASLEKARLAVVHLWPFLSKASSRLEFADRVELSKDKIEAAVRAVAGSEAEYVGLFPLVMSSLEEDFATLSRSRRLAAEDTEESDEDDAEGESEEESEEESEDGESEDEGSDDEMPEEMKDKNKESRRRTASVEWTQGTAPSGATYYKATKDGYNLDIRPLRGGEGTPGNWAWSVTGNGANGPRNQRGQAANRSDAERIALGIVDDQHGFTMESRRKVAVSWKQPSKSRVGGDSVYYAEGDGRVFVIEEDDRSGKANWFVLPAESYSELDDLGWPEPSHEGSAPTVDEAKSEIERSFMRSESSRRRASSRRKAARGLMWESTGDRFNHIEFAIWRMQNQTWQINLDRWSDSVDWYVWRAGPREEYEYISDVDPDAVLVDKGHAATAEEAKSAAEAAVFAKTGRKRASRQSQAAGKWENRKDLGYSSKVVRRDGDLWGLELTVDFMEDDGAYWWYVHDLATGSAYALESGTAPSIAEAKRAAEMTAKELSRSASRKRAVTVQDVYYPTGDNHDDASPIAIFVTDKGNYSLVGPLGYGDDYDPYEDGRPSNPYMSGPYAYDVVNPEGRTVGTVEAYGDEMNAPFDEALYNAEQLLARMGRRVTSVRKRSSRRTATFVPHEDGPGNLDNSKADAYWHYAEDAKTEWYYIYANLAHHLNEYHGRPYGLPVLDINDPRALDILGDLEDVHDAAHQKDDPDYRMYASRKRASRKRASLDVREMLTSDLDSDVRKFIRDDMGPAGMSSSEYKSALWDFSLTQAEDNEDAIKRAHVALNEMALSGYEIANDIQAELYAYIQDNEIDDEWNRLQGEWEAHLRQARTGSRRRALKRRAAWSWPPAADSNYDYSEYQRGKADGWDDGYASGMKQPSAADRRYDWDMEPTNDYQQGYQDGWSEGFRSGNDERTGYGSSVAPDWFDPTYAGERWDEDW